MRAKLKANACSSTAGNTALHTARWAQREQLRSDQHRVTLHRAVVGRLSLARIRSTQLYKAGGTDNAVKSTGDDAVFGTDTAVSGTDHAVYGSA